jgi:hypothetical protein
VFVFGFQPYDLQVALKSEDRQRDRWNDSLIKARHRAGKHVEATETAEQQVSGDVPELPTLSDSQSAFCK